MICCHCAVWCVWPGSWDLRCGANQNVYPQCAKCSDVACLMCWRRWSKAPHSNRQWVRESVPFSQNMHGALFPVSCRMACMRVASVQSEALASSVVVELMRPSSERMASAANFPCSMCRVLAVRAASTWPSAARRRKVEAFVCWAGLRLSSWARIREACTCARL